MGLIAAVFSLPAVSCTNAVNSSEASHGNEQIEKYILIAENFERKINES